MLKKSTVAIIGCDSYKKNEVFQSIEKGFNFFHKQSLHFAKNEHIVLKPNVLSGSAPDLCVTTHPMVFAGVIEYLKKLGVCISYGDSPGLLSPESALRNAKLSIVAEQYQIPLADFKNSEMRYSNTTLLKKKIPLAKGVLNADGLISICKLKTHALTRMTGAVKNQFGCVPGLLKARYHAQFPIIYDLSSLIVDINTLLAPRFYVMDAIYAMEGNGPQSGTPRKLGILLFSNDPVALDAVACKIVDINPDFIPTCRIGAKAGLGTKKYENIEIVGDPLEYFIDKKFSIIRKPPIFAEGTNLVNRFKRSLLPKPRIKKTFCVLCGSCINICPIQPKALNWKEGIKAKNPPVYDYDKCIRCFCCQEACVHKAIVVQTPFFSFLLPIVTIIRLGLSPILKIFKRRTRKG